jgi:hypothetical protein
MDAPFRVHMDAPSKPFVVSRNKHIAPKHRRVERLPSGYSVREFYNHPQGCYWYVIMSLEVSAGGEDRRLVEERQKLKGP